MQSTGEKRLAEQVQRPAAWAALGWLLLLGLGRLGTAGSTLAAPELGLPLFAGLLLASMALLLLPRNAQFARIAALACIAVGVLTLLRWMSSYGAEELLGNRVVDGSSVLGRYALSAWLLVCGLLAWWLAGPGTVGVVLALFASALMCLAVGALAAFALSCLLILGDMPDEKVVVSPALLVLALVQCLACVAACWSRVAAQARRQPAYAYRWSFARYLALLLGAGTIAGLGVLVLSTSHAVNLLTEGLLARAERQAQALERFVARQAALVATLRADGDRDKLERELGALTEGLEFLDAGVPQAHWPVLATEDYRAGLLADGGIVVEFVRGDIPRALLLRLRPRQMPGFLQLPAVAAGEALVTSSLLCLATQGGRQRCAPLQTLASGHRDTVAPFDIAPTARRDSGLVDFAGQDGAHVLAAPAALGGQGSQLLVRLDASSLYRIVGAPMLQVLWLLCGLGVLAVAWSTWRQLPALRELFHARALGEAAMQALPHAALLLDGAGRITRANAAAIRLLGGGAQDEAALLGAPIERFLPDGLPAVGGDAQADQADTALAPCTCRGRDAAGRELCLELGLASLQFADGEQRLLTMRDQSQHRRTTAELQRWKQVFEESSWGMAIASPGDPALIEHLNAAYADMLGYTSGQLIGQPLRACIAPALWESLPRLREQAMQDGTAQLPLCHRRRDGSEFPTLVSLSALRDGQGQLLHILISVQDISAIKQAEDEATRNAVHLSAVLDALPLGVWIGDEHGHVQQANRMARQFWQADVDGVALEREHETLLRRAAVTRERIAAVPVERPRADGGELLLLSTAAPVFDADGASVIGTIAIDEDQSARRRDEQALRQANELLERILESCAVGIALTDAAGHLLRHNPAWNLLLGPAPPQNVLETLLEPGDPLRRRGLLAGVGRGELPTYVGEHRLRRIDGSYGWALLIVSRLPGTADDTHRALVQLMDIDARRRAGDEIAASQLRLAAAQRLARVGDWQWDVEAGAFTCSEQMLSMLGCTQSPLGRLSRMQLFALVHEDDRTRLGTALDRALLNLGSVSEDVRLLRPDGVEMIAHLQGLTQRTPEGLAMAGTLQDVTERKRIEDELRQSRERLRELIAYEGQLIEDERKRIAREVHDELGQLLTALRMDLSQLRSELAPDTPSAPRVARMRETMATMAEVVRHVASNLRPAALDLGLVAAIEWLAEDFSLRWETEVDLQLPREQEPSLPEGVALALFRAVQESLTNIAKHAQATHVSIALSVTEDRLRLRVSDDGRGFDSAEVAARRGGGLGLLGMRERMHAIGAGLEIATGAAGTTVRIDYNISTMSSRTGSP